MTLRDNYITRAFLGRLRLWQVFWPLALFQVLVLDPLYGEAALKALTTPSDLLLWGLLALLLVPQTFVFVSIWNCAFKVNWAGWGWLARIGVLYFAWRLIASFTLMETLSLTG